MTAPTLAELAVLVSGATFRGEGTCQVLRAIHDSRSIREGDLYVALPGRQHHGLDFLQDALRNGAVGVGVSAVDLSRLEAALHVPVNTLILPQPRQALAQLAARCMGDPAAALALYGITGTNGKSSSAWLLHSIFRACDGDVGLFGTIETHDGRGVRPARFTTPEAPQLHESFRSMVDAGLRRCVMEVSSIGLEENRLEGVLFQGAAFLNLSQDHLDYHGSMAHYLRAKRRLFEAHLHPNAAVIINGEDPAGLEMISALPQSHQGPRWVLGEDLRWEGLRTDARGLQGRLCTPAGALQISSPLLGYFNQENIAVAAALALCAGVESAIITEVLAAAKPRGRMERVDVANGAQVPTVVVDYAHSPAALSAALAALRPLCPPQGQLWCLFGCGGDRDQGKRPAMGLAAGAADGIILSTDNPRSESPERIAQEAASALEARGWRAADRLTANAIWRCLDRRRAIEEACASLGPDDILLIAGKGHETYQEVKGVRHPFDDREVACQALSLRAALHRESGTDGAGGRPRHGEIESAGARAPQRGAEP
ncbi:MAG: UDP-N-acetylmuramoyl-L-alanyl-D-glutamate--2,6-diaminopimelate ligase [Myxococcota bacterium]|nr:UDP-N-acetylmuramoyl-L-alanyl-D-glutamate--2,6-diaminopimelate ligase [Myxococcota bacterium]